MTANKDSSDTVLTQYRHAVMSSVVLRSRQERIPGRRNWTSQNMGQTFVPG